MSGLTCAAWQVLELTLRAFWFMMLVYALVSWVPSLRGRWFTYVARIVEPVLQPVRKIIPPLGGLDLAFIVVLLALGYMMGLIQQVAYESSYCLIR